MDKSFIIKYQYLNDMDFYAVIKSYGVNFIRFDPNPDFEGLSGLIVKITPCASLPTSPLFFYLEDFCQRNLVLVRFFSLILNVEKSPPHPACHNAEEAFPRLLHLIVVVHF